MAQDLVTLTERWFAEVWNAGRDEAIDKMLAPDATIHGFGGPGELVIGPPGFRPGYKTNP